MTSIIPSSVGPQVSIDALPALSAATEAALVAQDIRRSNSNPDARQAASSLGAELAMQTPMFRPPAYWEMSDHWEVCRDLFAGTPSVRGNCGRYIPQDPAELPTEYANRVSRTEVYPGFQHSVKGLTGLVFRSDPKLQDDVPAQLKNDWEDIDGEGTHGAVFTKNVFQDGLTTGHVGILVDAPARPKDQRDAALTLAQEQSLGLRPYWVMIRAEQIYSWRVTKIGKTRILTQIVFHEATEEPAFAFGTQTISRYRIFRCDPFASEAPVTYEVREGVTESDPGVVVDEGIIPNQIRIPFVPIYIGEKLQPLHTRPLLLDLAYTNIAHIQVSSDRRNSMHLAGSPILVFKGRPIAQQMDAQGNPRQQVVGPNIGLDVPENGDVKYVEHQGHALQSMREELQDLEARMAALGISLLVRDAPARETATAKKLDKTEKDATIGAAARNMNDALEQALMFHAAYYKLPTGGSIFMDRDFSDFLLDPQTATLLSQMVAADQLDLETLWTVLQNRGILPEDMDHDAVKQNINANIQRTLNQMAALRTPGAPGSAAGAPAPTPKPEAAAA